MKRATVPEIRGHHVVDTSRKRCCQCGRVGTRGFKVIPEAVHEPTGAVLGPFVVCAADKACRKRWPPSVYLGSE